LDFDHIGKEESGIAAYLVEQRTELQSGRNKPMRSEVRKPPSQKDGRAMGWYKWKRLNINQLVKTLPKIFGS
jgi:hypothetical protein